nr:hypothetical protein [Bacteroidota bacterium]
MKNRIINTAAFILLLFLTNVKMQAQITRGATSGEIYIATDWYIGNGGLHYAILHSTDNGENISLQYENILTAPPGEMKVGQVLGDATPGAIYNWGWNELWISFDYGESWEYREDYPDYTKYFTGVNQGLIFKGNSQGFFKSTDYAQSFELLPITVTCPFTEVGFSEPEFYGIYGEPGLYYNFVHTVDYGQTYTEIPIDSTVAFWQVSGKYPEISRGTEPGELYLISWWPEAHYKIFHSTDTGYSWTLKYQSNYINLYYWGVQYTAGKEPGSFYVKRSRLNDTFDHSLLYVDYSSDYGETFTTYFHELDSLYTSITPIKKPDFRLSAFPNPFSNKTTIQFELPKNCKNYVLNICNIHGTIIRQFNIIGKESQQWDGRDNMGNLVSYGVYLYNINYNSISSQFNKLLFINQKQ